MTKHRMPLVTLAILSISLLAYYIGQADGRFIYDRSHSTELWRYAFASFSHYDLRHLLTNLFCFAILGCVLETKTSGQTLMFITLTTIVTTILFLHWLLPEYWTYAGISCVNYAILGYLLVNQLERNLIVAFVPLVLVIIYQTAVVYGISESTVTEYVPVWQLHVLSALIGGASALHRRSRNSIDAYPRNG